MFDNNTTKLSFLTVFLILGANLRERSEGSEHIYFMFSDFSNRVLNNSSSLRSE